MISGGKAGIEGVSRERSRVPELEVSDWGSLGGQARQCELLNPGDSKGKMTRGGLCHVEPVLRLARVASKLYSLLELKASSRS
ncbi:MAG: hypothetical protein JWR09_4651 [Mucilaginibacter sp.]|nr:hypothetical protein [Mucilaginibacter sp.]